MDKEFIKRIKKLRGSICLWSGSFNSPHSKTYDGSLIGGNYFIGDTFTGIPWKTREGKLLITYLLGNKKESTEAYSLLQKIENECLIAETERMTLRMQEVKKIDDKKRGYIYLLKSGNLYKIGKTLNIKERLKTYRAENPFGVEVIFSKDVDDYVGTERKLLEKFKDKKYRGEWFNLDKEDIKWIKQNT